MAAFHSVPEVAGNQLAQDPLSLVTMALAGNKGDISHTTRCGLTGLASAFARPSSLFHHAVTLASMVFDHSRSSLYCACESGP